MHCITDRFLGSPHIWVPPGCLGLERRSIDHNKQLGSKIVCKSKMLFFFCLLVATASASVINRHNARPGKLVVRDTLPAATTTSPTAIETAAELSAPTSSADAPAIVVEDTCTPSSVCFDGILSCGIRYGGLVDCIFLTALMLILDRCYDANYCDGNTSPYPIPTCSPTTSSNSSTVDSAPVYPNSASPTSGSEVIEPDSEARVAPVAPNIALEHEMEGGMAAAIVDTTR